MGRLDNLLRNTDASHVMTKNIILQFDNIVQLRSDSPWSEKKLTTIDTNCLHTSPTMELVSASPERTRDTNFVITAPSGPVFCLLLWVSSDYAQPITGQVTEVTCPVIGRV